MKNRPSPSSRTPRQAPLDHLRPGGRHPSGPDDSPAPETRPHADPQDVPGDARRSWPSEPATPGAGDADAVRGKSTGSPAAVATRPHLEGSEQGPS